MRLTHVLSITLLAGCQTMQSQDVAKSEILSATRAWAEALNTCNPARISALYDREAVLWATTSSSITSTPEGVRKYFDGVCASPTPPKVQFGEQLIRVHGDTAIDSGSYTFTVIEGREMVVPARFTLCQRRLKTAQFWRLKIAHHDWFGSVTRLRLACAPDWFRCFDIGLQSAIQLGVLTHSIAVATNID